MIIDFHTHIFPPRLIKLREQIASLDPVFGSMYSNPKARMITADDLVKTMDEQGIEISVIQNIQWKNLELCRESNDYIVEAVSRFPERLIGFGMVPLDWPEKAVREIERCFQDGLKGIGEIRPSRDLLRNHSRLQPLIQALIEYNMILLTHCSEPVGHIYEGKGDITPEVLYPFIAAFPKLKLICAHWGGGLPFYALMPEVKKALDNVYFDSAASPFLYTPQIYAQVSQILGPDKILFGSDYPLIKPQRFLQEIQTSELSAETRSHILSGNASRLLGIECKG